MSKTVVYNQCGDNMHVDNNVMEYVISAKFPVIAMNNNKVEMYNTANRNVCGTWMGHVLTKNKMRF